MTNWIPLTEGKPIPDTTYWITDGEYRCLAETFYGNYCDGSSIKDWSRIEGSFTIAGLSYDGVEDFQLMKHVTHYAEFEPMSVPELPSKSQQSVIWNNLPMPEIDKWISVEDRLPNKDDWYFVFTNYHEMTSSYYCEMDSHKWFDTDWFASNDKPEQEDVFCDKVTHWQPMPKPPIQLTVNLDEDVADIREERICKNCKHYTPANYPAKKAGECSKIGITNGIAIFYGDEEGGCDVFEDFGCNQWQRKDEITHYVISANRSTNNTDGIRLKPAKKGINSFTNFHTQKVYGYHKGKPVYFPYYIEKQMDDIDND